MISGVNLVKIHNIHLTCQGDTADIKENDPCGIVYCTKQRYILTKGVGVTMASEKICSNTQFFLDFGYKVSQYISSEKNIFQNYCNLWWVNPFLYYKSTYTRQDMSTSSFPIASLPL